MKTIVVSDGASAAWMLARREWTRFFRQRNRVTAAILQPAVVLVALWNGTARFVCWSWRIGFFAILLAGDGGTDRVVHGDLCHDFGDRGSS